MLDTTTGEVVKMTLAHEGNNVREFYSTLPRPVRVGIEATGSMQWFVNLMEELGIECQVGNPAVIRASERRAETEGGRDAREGTNSGTSRYKIRYRGLQLDAERNRGNRNYEQVNNINGRPVRARTADLHRVKVAL